MVLLPDPDSPTRAVALPTIYITKYQCIFKYINKDFSILLYFFVFYSQSEIDLYIILAQKLTLLHAYPFFTYIFGLCAAATLLTNIMIFKAELSNDKKYI